MGVSYFFYVLCCHPALDWFAGAQSDFPRPQCYFFLPVLAFRPVSCVVPNELKFALAAFNEHHTTARAQCDAVAAKSISQLYSLYVVGAALLVRQSLNRVLSKCCFWFQINTLLAQNCGLICSTTARRRRLAAQFYIANRKKKQLRLALLEISERISTTSKKRCSIYINHCIFNSECIFIPPTSMLSANTRRWVVCGYIHNIQYALLGACLGFLNRQPYI